jgi:hypothetical protein
MELYSKMKLLLSNQIKQIENIRFPQNYYHALTCKIICMDRSEHDSDLDDLEV